MIYRHFEVFKGVCQKTGRAGYGMKRHLALICGIFLMAMAGAAVAGAAPVPQANPARAKWYPPGTPVSKPTNTSDASTPTASRPADSLPVAGAAPAAEPVVINARIGQHPDRTRFVVEISDPVKFRVFTLANPNRVVIDLPEVLWRLQGPPQASTGVVKSYRYGLFRPGNSRFVIDLNAPVDAATPMILPPQDGYGYRMVLDLFPTTQAKFDKSAGWPADLRARENAAIAQAATPPPNVDIAPATNAPGKAVTRSARMIVIDPGHGGLDSGTTGLDGLQEKNLVLDEGKRLRTALKARGYRVHMTRDTGVFVPLYSRAPIAHNYKADLFISLHADSNPNPSVKGLSVYTLSERGSDKEAAALANKENQSDIIAGVDLSGDNSSVASILIDLAQRDTMNRSVRFAKHVLASVTRVTDVLPRSPHRSANFVVLRGPDVPAVLIELGYLSNKGDNTQMRSTAWRNRVASAIADAVDRQFGYSPEKAGNAGGTLAAQASAD